MILPSRLVIAAWLLVAPLLPDASAQGPVYRERWGYLHLENRRAELFDELLATAGPRSDEQWAEIGSLCAAEDAGVPFVPVARALAGVRGVEADAAFVLRTTISTFVLPEVVDPEASNEVGHKANFSIYLPFPVPIPGEVSFELRVRDADGKVVWQQTVAQPTGLEDLRMARPRASMPAAEHPDGAYEVELRTLIGGEPPREKDPVLRWTFHIERGYQARSEAAVARARELRAELEPLPRALLDGFALQVTRAYAGEAFAVRSEAVRELETLERALQNLADGRPVLAGVVGPVTTSMPAGDIVQPCRLRLRNGDRKPRPLVVFATGSPAYNIGARRPTEPSTREAAWLQRELGTFGDVEGWQVVCFDSPGAGRPFAQSLLRGIQALAAVVPTGGSKPLLVCDREAAAVIGLRLAEYAPHLAGVVLVGAGAVPARALDQLGDLPVRMVALQDYPGTKAIDRMMAFRSAMQQTGKPLPNLARLHERRLPWLFGVALSREEITSFATQVFRDG